MFNTSSLGSSLGTFSVRYGFMGIDGIFGIFIGLICLIVVCGLGYKITMAVSAKMGADAGWQQILSLILILLIFLCFLHFFGLY
jgi:hypothetical protein